MKPVQLGKLAADLDLECEGDPALEVRGLAGLRDASSQDLSFVTGERYRKDFEVSEAGAYLAPPDFDTDGRPCLRTRAPYADFARAIEVLHPRSKPAPGVHETAILGGGVALGEDVSVGPYCVVGAGASIGDRTCIHAHVTLYPGVRIGVDCEIHSGVHLRDEVTLGDRCVIQNGAVIGGEGFGFTLRADGTRIRVPHRCPVEIGHDCEIGANSTIDASHPGHPRRGHAEVRTRLGNGVKVDNLVQIGHGTDIGDGATLCALVGLGGSSEVGRGVYIGGQAGVADGVRIGPGALIGGGTGVAGDIEAGAQVLGYPPLERRLWWRVMAASRRLPQLLRRVREIEKKVDIASED